MQDYNFEIFQMVPKFDSTVRKGSSINGVTSKDGKGGKEASMISNLSSHKSCEIKKVLPNL